MDDPLHSPKAQKPTPLGTLDFLQINLNHCRAANPEAIRYMEENSVDLALLQDVHCGGDGDLTNFSGYRYLASTLRIWSSETHVWSPTINCIFITLTAAEEEIIIGSIYIPPLIQDFDTVINECQHLITKRDQLSVEATSMHARCSGEVFIKIPEEKNLWISLHNLILFNKDNWKHAFIKKNSNGDTIAKGFPDQTIVNFSAQSHMLDWQVHNPNAHSDQKYITYSCQTTPIYTSQRRFNTKFGNFKKFTELIKAWTHKLKTFLDNIMNTDQLNSIHWILGNTIQFMCSLFRLISFRKTPSFSFWTPQYVVKETNSSLLGTH